MESVEKYKDLLGERLYRRAKHVTSECERVRQSVIALNNGDLETFGKLMCESHQSLRYDYEVTGKELDTLAEAAQAQEGCIGSRMTGAGFGGCTVNIVREDAIEEFKEKVGKNYTDKIGYAPSFYVSDLGDGGREIK